jgi:spore maturation protein CgeB
MIKVLYLPLNAGNPQTGMYDAFNSIPNINLSIFDYYGLFESKRNKNFVNESFIKAVKEFQPDLVHMQLQMTDIIEPSAIMEARKQVNKNVIFTNWSGDVRNTASAEILKIAPAVDFTFISSVGQIPLYQQAGCQNVRYWQIGYDPKIFFPKNQSNFTYDLVFAGNAYPPGLFVDTQKRYDLIVKLKSYFGDRFGVFGSGYRPDLKAKPISGSEVNNVYNSSLSIFSMSNYNDISHYFSDRLLTCLASGRPTISYNFPDYQSYFSNNCDIIMASTFEEIVSMVEWCKSNMDQANRIGQAGAKKVQSQHTYKSRVIELLRLLGFSHD